jgi:structural maintenance of chromosome 2
MYDFEGMDIGQSKERASQLEESQKGMKKKVNPKVMNMIDKWVFFGSIPCVCYVDVEWDSVEKREDDLKRMLATVMKDKEKIEETIEELDRYKRDALQKTWETVNGYEFTNFESGTYVDAVRG